MIIEWHQIIEDYGRLVEDDAPYWYNERANISILAGAAWRAGKLALEEFGHEKSYKRGQNRGDRWMGRCDLWLIEKKEEELVEAKFKWVPLTSNTFSAKVEASLSDAIDDAHNGKQVRGARSVGVAFIPVYIPIKYKNEIEAHIDQRIKEAKSVSADCIAWCFPEKNRFLTGASGKFYNPGIFLFAKCV
jgi:hypothetical protein